MGGQRLSSSGLSLYMRTILIRFSIPKTVNARTPSSRTRWTQLAQDEGEFAKVKANPELIPSLVDEAIRWMTPVKHFMRSATADTELGGRKIAKGAVVVLPAQTVSISSPSTSVGIALPRQDAKPSAFAVAKRLAREERDFVETFK
ncbi:hypothetical protein ACVIHI_008554 [Bradyrhizobium sp. USDA 4524]|uniref:hypothetical protein n=1 Tax=Bradyrhizobium sp. USDA 4538 TaxID=2817702 RepID=UPI0020A40407|nr:hypothetical protein [Bradyrhizobium sp. USDA 4538]